MTNEERKAIKDKCDALIAEFDAQHPEIAAIIKFRKPGEIFPIKEEGMK